MPLRAKSRYATIAPSSTVNAANRREAAAVLTRADGRLHVRRTALKGVLLLLAGASLVIAGQGALAPFRAARSSFDTAMTKALSVTSDNDCLFVCLFHGQATCTACETMGRLCRQTVETDFASLQCSGVLAFREIAYETPENRAIKDQLELYSTTIGLVRYDHGKPQGIRMLTQSAWSLWTDEAAFVRMLQAEHPEHAAGESLR